MAKSYKLGPNAAAALLRSHDQTRYDNQSMANHLRQYAAIRHPRKTSQFGIADEDIKAPKLNPGPTKLTAGKVIRWNLNDDGTFIETGEEVQAFNFAPRDVKKGEGVILLLDWDTGRWLIIFAYSQLIATKILILSLGGFTTADAQFPARIVTPMDGLTPKGFRWSASGSDVVYNPPTATGHLFQGVSNSTGYATWHDADPERDDLPIGYWCDQLECQMA